MLGGQAIFREQHPHSAGPSQSGGQLAVAAKRAELVTSAVQEDGAPGRCPFPGRQASGPAPRQRSPPSPGRRQAPDEGGPRGEGGTALLERRRGLAGTGLLPVPESVDQVLHGLTRHVGISFGQSCLATQQPYGTPGSSLSASPAPSVLGQRAPRRRRC